MSCGVVLFAHLHLLLNRAQAFIFEASNWLWYKVMCGRLLLTVMWCLFILDCINILFTGNRGMLYLCISLCTKIIMTLFHTRVEFCFWS